MEKPESLPASVISELIELLVSYTWDRPHLNGRSQFVCTKFPACGRQKYTPFERFEPTNLTP